MQDPARGLDASGRRRVLRWAALCSVSTLLAACTTPPAPPVAPPAAMRAPRVGLALGGGAARGFAHLGVIEVLESEGLRPDLVVGTSAGSLVAALYASGRSVGSLLQAARNMNEATLTDWTLPLFRRGMLRGDALAAYVNREVEGRLIEDMPLPLGILATDLGSGEPILFRRGDTGAAVRASSAVPGVFEPVKIRGREYVDGGLVAPVPVRFARAMGAELVLAVDISAQPSARTPGDALKVLLQTFAIMGQSINRHELQDAEIVVRPRLTGMGAAAFDDREAAIQAGRDAMRAQLGHLRERLAREARPLVP